MSAEIDLITPHINGVDVDGSEKDFTLKSDINSDSGVDTGESSYVACNTSSDSELSPLKYSEASIYLDDKNNTEKDSFISPISVCSSDPKDNLGSNEFLVETNVTSHNNEKQNEYCGLQEINVQQKDSATVDSSAAHIEFDGTEEMSRHTISDLEKASNRNLTTSTISLNEPDLGLNNSSISKSPFSRSAENIVSLEELQKSSLNSSTKDLNTKDILLQFASQKTKVSATQKIVTETLHTNDAKQGRKSKEILTQDLGNIVKNVHGIFWSVSGNLKNAYTQRVSAHKLPIKNNKPIMNGKAMSDILEDTSCDKSKIIQENHVCDNADESELNLNAFDGQKLDQDHNKDVENDTKKDVFKLQVESLEKMLSEQRKENAILRDRVKQQVDELHTKDQTFKELEVKLDLMSKRVEQAQKDADGAVMRYAGAECAAIEGRRAAEAAKRAQLAAEAESELLTAKLRSAHAEKQRICQLYDDKCHELQNSEREMSKLREDLRELEGRLKWTQSKLRLEMDAYKESSERAEKLSQQVTELEAAKEAAAVGANDSARAKVLDADLKESQAALILCRHERDELERRLANATQQLEACTKERDDKTDALTRANDEVERLKAHNLRLEEEAAELAALRAQAALADTLSSQLHRETERASAAEEALGRERARAETCARREAAALEHAARLTAQHVAQRARSNEHEAKAQALSADNASLRERSSTLEAECERLRSGLEEETERRQRENRVLARKVAELTEEIAEVNKRLEWEKGENSVLKKKHASAIRELNRELQRALKRCEQLEAKVQPEVTSTRTGSVTSLSSAESTPPEDRQHNGLPDSIPGVQAREPERQALIERIVSLQRAAARRAERCDFLEEHARQLTEELRGKSRVLRHLLATQPAGAVASPRSDANKKEIARLGGGAMAAVWGGDPGGMTLELSLEMNQRLQALLEDTLLKNITLKENIDTLGEEISRLKADRNKSAEKK